MPNANEDVCSKATCSGCCGSKMQSTTINCALTMVGTTIWMIMHICATKGQTHRVTAALTNTGPANANRKSYFVQQQSYVLQWAPVVLQVSAHQQYDGSLGFTGPSPQFIFCFQQSLVTLGTPMVIQIPVPYTYYSNGTI